MNIGWFLLLTSIIGFFRVKRFEMSVRASRTGGPPALTADDIQRDMALRRNLEEVFGIRVLYDSEVAAPAPTVVRTFAAQDAHGMQRGDPPRSSAEIRFENDLRAA